MGKVWMPFSKSKCAKIIDNNYQSSLALKKKRNNTLKMNYKNNNKTL